MEAKMILYHGSNVNFDTVSLDFARDKRDFGRGFYTTTIKEQAALHLKFIRKCEWTV